MKKIVFVMEQMYGGGAERVTAALMNELCNEAEIHLITTYRTGEEQEYLTDKRIIRHRIWEERKLWIGTVLDRVRFLRKTITEIDPYCVVSLATPRTATLITAAMFGKRIPLILSERNDPNRFPEEKLIRGFRLVNYYLCSGLVFQTHDARDYFPKCISKKSVVICNPLTGNLPPRYDGERERRIINCCRLVPQKNLDLLIEAFSDIAQEYSDVSLVIFGEGSERQRLEKKIQDSGLADRVYLPGYSDDIYTEMRSCTMFVSSSDYEGISNSMLEAIALGVPTISTDCPVGGAREAIQDGVNGVLVPVGDRTAMAQAMRRILSDRDLADRLSVNGYKLRDDISVGAIARKWAEYIYRIAG